jgi:hypothetical protein
MRARRSPFLRAERERVPWWSRLNISFWTMSVASPTTNEELRRLGQRGPDLLVAVALDGGAEGGFQGLPPPDLVGEDVVHPLGGAVLHGSG